MQGAVVAYARTSTVDQEAGLQAQVEALKAAGAAKLFVEQISSVNAERPQLRAALDYVREGDVFLVTTASRLARSTIDLLNIVDGLANRGVTVRILDLNIDTSTATGRLLLTLLGAVSTAEREWMLERQRHGIARAKALGKYRGRKPTARTKAKDICALKAEGLGVAEIVRRTGVSRASVYRILDELSQPMPM